MNIRYRYSYDTVFNYYPPVDRHSFRLRYIPMTCNWQRPEFNSLDISPAANLRESTDSWGNNIQWGEIVPPHDRLVIKSRGVIVQCDYYMEQAISIPIYYVPTALTRVCDEMINAYPDALGRDDILNTADYIMSRTYEAIDYSQGVTDFTDSAITSWQKGMGVCQDMAHIMIAVCRKLGIASRYVAGLIEGEGQTHAWVEVSDGKVWIPFDPTHNRRPKEGYVKLSHGRDAADCASVRGHFFNLSTETMEVECKLEKI